MDDISFLLVTIALAAVITLAITFWARAPRHVP